MAWLQENLAIVVVGVVIAVVLLWWLFGRRNREEIAPPVEPAKPAAPLAPVRPEIVAAEPARFKPIEPRPVPQAPPPPVAQPAPEPPAASAAIPEEPTVPAEAPEPIAETPAPRAARKAEPEIAIPVEPTVPSAAPEAEPIVSAPEPASSPTTAKTDNLQLIKGLGPKMAVLLNGLGVTSFQQIADWTAADIAAIDPQLGAFQGRIARDNLVDQAGYLARGDKAGFEAKYGALGGDL